MGYFVYILQSQKDNRYYIGSTQDVAARLFYHNAGMQRSTRSRTPFILIYSEECIDKHTALLRERQIKAYKGGEAFKRLIGK